MAETKNQNTPMSIERIIALISAMEDNAWELLQIDTEKIGSDDLSIERRTERWITLRSVKRILTDSDFAEDFAKIFLSDESKAEFKEDTEEGGESDA
jgi:hypothetical protein